MIKKLKKFVPAFFILLLTACSQMPDELKLAQKSLDSSPDSALCILQHIPTGKKLSDSNRALYGLLFFQALGKIDKPLQPDSLIDFSISYYFSENNKFNLAKCYFLKAKMYKMRQQFENAVNLYLQSLSLIKSTNNYLLLDEIYSDLADICIMQKDDSESLKKF